jgi:hypothetical protein
MIPFFRKIRKKMADDNKPMKYMRYALGEIALVVIGILIALSINNWNEERKLRIQEIKTLKELTADLNQSLIDIQADKLVFEKQKLSIEIILNHIKNKLPLNDSLRFHFSKLHVFQTFSINNSTFNNINKMDDGLISNDSLRRSIAKFFTHPINLYKEVEDRILQEHNMNYLKPMIISQFITYDINSLEPRDYKSYIENKDNTQILNYTIVMLSQLMVLQSYLIKEIKSLELRIRIEIEVLD